MLDAFLLTCRSHQRTSTKRPVSRIVRGYILAFSSICEPVHVRHLSLAIVWGRCSPRDFRYWPILLQKPVETGREA